MPIELTYHTLPPQSRLKQEVLDDGSVMISLPAGEPGELARSQVMWSSAWFGAVAAIAIVVVLLYAILPNVRSLGPPWMVDLLLICCGIFVAALQLLIWWVSYRNRLDEFDRDAHTVIVISPGKLLVEIAAKDRNQSEEFDWPYEMQFHRLAATSLKCIEIEVHGEPRCRIFGGLSDSELHWVAMEINRIIRRPQT